MAAYLLTVREGPRVDRIRLLSLERALDELERRGSQAAAAAGAAAVDLRVRRFEPVQQVVARLELRGPGRLRAGIDVRGDGSVEGYTGRLRRRLVDQAGGEAAWDAVRRVLLPASREVIPSRPMPNEIRSERLLLRQLDLEEARALAAGRKDGLRPAADGYPLEGTIASASMVVRRGNAGVDMSGFGSYQVIRLEDGVVIGDIGFHGPPDPAGGVVIGYGLAPDARGAGYATEALVALSEWALEQPEVKVVNADAALENRASQRVMERAGMRFVNETAEKRFYRLP